MIYQAATILAFCTVLLLNYYKNKTDATSKLKSYDRKDSLRMKNCTLYPYWLSRISIFVTKNARFLRFAVFYALCLIGMKLQIVLRPPFATHELVPRTKTYAESSVSLKDQWLSHLIDQYDSNVVLITFDVPNSSLVTTRCIIELFLSPLKSKMSPASAFFLN